MALEGTLEDKLLRHDLRLVDEAIREDQLAEVALELDVSFEQRFWAFCKFLKFLCARVEL